MTVTDVQQDAEALTLTVTAELDATLQQAWQLWADPRLLERWWGPPTYPATVVDHDLAPGGQVSYYMTGPEGDRVHGWWRVTEASPPKGLEFEDGFADAGGEPDPTKPTMIMQVSIQESLGGRTQMAIRTSFSSAEDMEQMAAMGMAEGMTTAVSQIDALLAAGPS
jgi:uncharacterized protein YndB with AHSA1/START domain